MIQFNEIKRFGTWIPPPEKNDTLKMYSARHNLKFLLFHRKSHPLFSRYSVSYILNQTIIFESCGVMISISTRVRIHF